MRATSYIATETEVRVLSQEFFLSPAWKPLCDWLAKHGVDARDVPVVCQIQRHPGLRQITLPILERDAEGHLIPDPRGGVVERIRAVQLEAPPMPFPPELEVCR